MADDSSPTPPPATPAPAPSPAEPTPRPHLDGPDILPLIGERIRWELLRIFLRHSSRSIQQLVPMIGRERSLISQHVRVLIDAGLVRKRTEGITDHRSHQYELVPMWRVPGAPWELDFGCARVRFGPPA